jgi:uncharacterized protein YggE
MKKYWLVAMSLVLVLAVVGFAGCTPGSSTTIGTVDINSQQTGIWVSGTGKVTVTPDIAMLSLGIEAQADTVAGAQEQAAAAMAAVMTALKDAGIDDEDIQTQYFNIREVTNWEVRYDGGEKEVVIGYEVTNTVSVKIRDVTKAGAVIDAVVTAGGDLTRVNGIDFTVEDPAPYYEQAREKAADYAKAKAQQMADLTGVKLGNVTYVSESSSYYHGGGPNYYREDMMAVPAPTIYPTEISVGTLEITATVQVAYAIAD